MKKIFLLLIFTMILLSGCSSTSSNYSNYNSDDGCCKHCVTGKACGDSCISSSYTCHKGAGCACDY